MKKNFEKIAKNLFSAMEQKDIENFSTNLCEDVSLDFPGLGMIKGKRKVIVAIKAILRKYKFLKFDVYDFLYDQNKAFALWTNKGETTDGTPYANAGATFFIFRDDKILSISDYFKDTSFTNQGK